MTELEHAIKHIKTRADAWAVKEVTEALRGISERLDKALSQEPTDAISRKDAISALRKTLYEYEDKAEKQFQESAELDVDEWFIHRIYVQNMNDADVKAISKLPSVTQNLKYWIDKDNKLYKMPDDIPTMTIQYPTITHGDTISRTEVMKVISDFVTFEKYIDKHNHITFEPLEKMINALPPVTQKSETVTEFADRCRECGKMRKGHWISHYDEDAKEGWYECDRCHTERAFNTKFCPDCGARMESEDKE